MQRVGLAPSDLIKHAGRTDPGASECVRMLDQSLYSEAVLPHRPSAESGLPPRGARWPTVRSRIPPQIESSRHRARLDSSGVGGETGQATKLAYGQRRRSKRLMSVCVHHGLWPLENRPQHRQRERYWGGWCETMSREQAPESLLVFSPRGDLSPSLKSAFGAKPKWTSRQSRLTRSKMTLLGHQPIRLDTFSGYP
jgi:hypothetical protein